MNVKIAFIGDKGVGKTSLIKAVRNMGKFTEKYRPSQGLDFYTIKKDKLVIQLWDTADDTNTFDHKDLAFRKSIDVIVVCYDSTMMETSMIPRIERWIDQFRADFPSDHVCPVIVCATKTDKEMPPLVREGLIGSHCRRSDYVHVSTSAKDEKGIEELRDGIVTQSYMSIIGGLRAENERLKESAKRYAELFHSELGSGREAMKNTYGI